MKRELPPVPPVRQAADLIIQDWRRTGDDMLQAIQESAEALGGPDLRDHVTDLAVDPTGRAPLPLPRSIEFLNDLVPGATETIFDRTLEIQKARHLRESLEARKYGRKAGLWGFLSGLTLSRSSYSDFFDSKR